MYQLHAAYPIAIVVTLYNESAHAVSSTLRSLADAIEVYGKRNPAQHQTGVTRSSHLHSIDRVADPRVLLVLLADGREKLPMETYQALLDMRLISSLCKSDKSTALAYLI